MWLRIAVLACAGFAPIAGAQVQKWVDENGKVHYGDRGPASASTVTPPPAAGGSPAAGAPRNFSECTSRACAAASRGDPTCRTSLCREAMTIPDDCHTITCQAKRAEIEKRAAEARTQSTQAERRTMGSSTAQQSASDQARAQAQARCKANRGVDCDSSRGLQQWINEDKPMTREQQQQAVQARQARERQAAIDRARQ